MHISRETKIADIACLILVIFSAAFHLLMHEIEVPFSDNNVIFLIYVFIILIWVRQIKRRVLQKQVRNYLSWSGFMMIFWMSIRTLKYIHIPSGVVMARYIWYLYYCCIAFIALFLFLSVSYIGKKAGEGIAKKWKLLYIPTILFSILILTNDWHQGAYFFHTGVENWSDTKTTYGWVYYLAMIYVGLLLSGALITVFLRCSVPEMRKNIWIPAIPPILGLLYCILYLAMPRNNWILIAFKAPEVGCTIFIAFMECLILTRFFPSNDNYKEFWKLSSLKAGIIDSYGQETIISTKSISVEMEEIQKALKSAVMLDEKTVLRSHPVTGGYCFWAKDISELNRLNKELMELGDILAEENEILKAESQIVEEKSQVEKQSELYHEISIRLKPQLQKLDELLKDLPVDEESFRKQMKIACIYNAFIKRYSNLIIMSQTMNTIPMDELKLALIESCEYIELFGAECFLSWKGQSNLLISQANFLYEIFEAAIEKALPEVTAVLIHVMHIDDKVVLSIQMNQPSELLSKEEWIAKLEKESAELQIEYVVDERTEYITLQVQAGEVR